MSRGIVAVLSGVTVSGGVVPPPPRPVGGISGLPIVDVSVRGGAVVVAVVRGAAVVVVAVRGAIVVPALRASLRDVSSGRGEAVVLAARGEMGAPVGDIIVALRPDVDDGGAAVEEAVRTEPTGASSIGSVGSGIVVRGSDAVVAAALVGDITVALRPVVDDGGAAVEEVMRTDTPALSSIGAVGSGVIVRGADVGEVVRTETMGASSIGADGGG
ncbi:MAG TPA: hypothetical protein VMZ53_00485, partial [Kofleriaceae bacterium]|nr:hypothetical protein [Kofleriaceae bacterium]